MDRDLTAWTCERTHNMLSGVASRWRLRSARGSSVRNPVGRYKKGQIKTAFRRPARWQNTVAACCAKPQRIQSTL